MSSNDLQKLSQPEWDMLQDRADRFAEALRAGTAGDDWDAYLDGLDPELRRAVLHEMIKIDLDERWLHGRKRLLEEYIPLHPELGSVEGLPADLIGEEFRIRRKRGDSPDIAEYYGRFPRQFEAFRQNIGAEKPSLSDQTQETDGTFGPAKMHTVVSSPSDLLRQAGQTKQNQPAQTPDNYEKTEMLGHGHFGEVWKAKAPGGIEVAIKVVTQPIGRDAAQRELQALELVKNLRHPCLLSTSAFWIENDRLHIVMELADGTMRDRLKQCRKQNLNGIPRNELLMYFADAAEGLDFLHTRKVFHRDIKPDNILLLHGHAKVADFGLARLQERQMMTVSFAGTPVYMAPEAWGGKGGPRSDQYSLAFAYAELRQGRRPIEANDLAEVMGKTLESEPDLGGLPPEEANVVRRALAKKPEDRFESCGEFVAALARATGTPVRLRAPSQLNLHAEEPAAPVDSDTYRIEDEAATQRQPVPKRRNKMAPLVGAAVLAGLGGFGLWNFVLKEPPKSNDAPPNNVAKDNESKESVAGAAEKKTADKIRGAVGAPFVPPKFVAAPGAAIVHLGSRDVAERIEYVHSNGDRTAFVLVVPPSNAGLRPYYMMENKATNGLFAEFADRNPTNVGSTEWRNAKLAKLPVTRINAAEANRLAHWLGGDLPTSKQWDFAAGLFNREGRSGPSLKEGVAAVGRSEPRAVDEGDDVGPRGIRDLAGNGREWTRNVLLPDGSMGIGPLDSPTARDLAVLRGRNFTLPKPLTYADMDYEEKTPQTQYYLKGSPYTTFRLVVEINE